MRISLSKHAFACALVALSCWPCPVTAIDCPTGACPLPQFIPHPPPAIQNTIVVDPRPIARIQNALDGGLALGSGTLVDVDDTTGIVITCAHLFREGVGRVAVSFPDVKAVSGRVLKVDAAADLSAIAIPASGLPVVEVAVQYPQRGEPVVSCGYGSDGRLYCNRGQVLGYVVTLGSRGRETLELTGLARQGDSGGPVLNERGQLVGVLFGTNGRVVDATYCGRVRSFLEGLSARFGGGGAGESPGQSPAAPSVAPPSSDAARPLDALPPILRRPKPNPRDQQNEADEKSGPLGKAAEAAESAAETWLSAKLAALLVSFGVPGGVAGLAGGAAVWLVMRRGKRRLQAQLDALRARHAPASAGGESGQAAPGDSEPNIVQRHHNRYVPYEASSVDRAWASAHARVSERYPGAVPYLKIVEGVKDQLLSGIEEPLVS